MIKGTTVTCTQYNYKWDSAVLGEMWSISLGANKCLINNGFFTNSENKIECYYKLFFFNAYF